MTRLMRIGKKRIREDKKSKAALFLLEETELGWMITLCLSFFLLKGTGVLVLRCSSHKNSFFFSLLIRWTSFLPALGCISARQEIKTTQNQNRSVHSPEINTEQQPRGVVGVVFIYFCARILSSLKDTRRKKQNDDFRKSDTVIDGATRSTYAHLAQHVIRTTTDEIVGGY